MKVAILLFSLLFGINTYATPLGDALNACLRDGKIIKIPVNGSTDVNSSITCTANSATTAAKQLFFELRNSGFRAQDGKTSNGESVQVILFGKSGQQSTQCRFFFLDRDGNSLSLYSCSILLDLSDSLLPHIGF